MFGLIAGLFIGVALAFLLDYLDYSLRTPEDVEELVSQAPLGIVGTINMASPLVAASRTFQLGELLGICTR